MLPDYVSSCTSVLLSTVVNVSARIRLLSMLRLVLVLVLLLLW
jgi:hypothetical protein